MKKPKRRRHKPFVVTIIIFFVIIVGILSVFGYSNVKSLICSFNISDIIPQKLNLRTTEVPEYVDVDLINIGLARKGFKLKHINDIVIHYTGNPGTSAKNNRDYFAKTDTTVCSHFVIGLDGEIIQCIPLDERSAASNQRNKDTISIEVCHPTEDGKFTDNTYNSVVKFTAWLLQNCDLNADNVIRHYDITGKICPKYYVDNCSAWEKMKNDIKNELDTYK